MHSSSAISRFLPALICVLAILAGVGDAVAQSSCAQLGDDLRTLDRNGDFRNIERITRQARDLANDVQDAESAYVRNGCNDAARRGETLTRDCRNLARTITRGREDRDALAQSVETGNAIAQQREAILQELSRFGCGANSEASVERRDRGTLFDRIFGGYTDDEEFPDGEVFSEDFQGYVGYSTVRTVCVRACDGYYWPVSYSTLSDYAWNDAQQCQAQCPGSASELYYYSNPGQEPEQMVSLTGSAYTALPNAFRYRREFDASCSCKAPLNQGSISLIATSGGQSRAVIDFSGTTFPLPLNDPRRPALVTTNAAIPIAEPQPLVQPADVASLDYANVPLPRRRPLGPGETPPTRPIAPPPEDTTLRLVQFGDKTVRVVGPDTPYAQPVEAGT